MMKNKILVWSFFLLTLSAGSAYAGGNTGWTTLSLVHPWSNGLHLTVKNGVNDPSSCGGGNGGFMILPSTASEYKLISSVLLLAFSMGKEVLVYTDGCLGGGSQIIGAMSR